MIVASHHSLAHPSHAEGVAATRQLTDLGGQNLSGIVMLEQLRFMGLVRLCPSLLLLTCCAVIKSACGGRGALSMSVLILGAQRSSSWPSVPRSCRWSSGSKTLSTVVSDPSSIDTPAARVVTSASVRESSGSSAQAAARC